jgi:Ca2+-binding EF-hand superfamily protein
MGCIGTRPKFVEEDEQLTHKCQALGFSRHRIDIVDYALRKYSADGKVNANQLKAVSSALNLHLQNYDTHKTIDKFVASLQVSGQEVISADKLMVTGLLLAQGKLSDRAVALFEVVDREEAGSVDLGRLLHLLNLWIDAVVGMGVLGEDTDFNLRIADYCGKCRSSKDRWIATMKGLFPGDSVTKEAFVRETLKAEHGGFLEPASFRVYLANDAMKHPVDTSQANTKNTFAALRLKLNAQAGLSQPAAAHRTTAGQ